MATTTRDTAEAASIGSVMVPDSKLAREATELVRDTESPLLFNHSTRVYYFGSLAGKPEQKQLLFDNTLRATHGASQEVLERHVANCRRDDPAYGESVARVLKLNVLTTA